MSLIYESEWKQTTGITPEDAANRAREMFDLYLKSGDTGECDDMACCDDQVILQRFNPDTGRPEVSKDGGVTWTPSPSDTQNSIPLYPPIVGDGKPNTKCDAATNASEHINELIEATKTNLETATTIFELATAVAEAALAVFIVIVSGGALSPLVATLMAAIWAAATGVFALGIEAYDAYWTTDKKDAILCALYCNIGENGQFTESQYQAFRAKVKATLPASPAFDIIMTTINAGGAIGVSQMASYGNAAEADCSSCDCSDCEHGIDDVWTFNAVHDVVFDGCRTYTMVADGGAFHFSGTTGDCNVGTYWDIPLLWTGSSTWSKTTACVSPDNVDPKTHEIWNFDVGPLTAGDIIVVVFSSDPI